MTTPHACPHCRYVRKVSDATVPDWQCPHCEKAYSKVDGGPPAGTRSVSAAAAGRRGGWLKWLLLLALLGGGAWAVRRLPPVPVVNSTAQQPEVVLYATSWCGYCARTRAFFEANGIAYTEYDIERSTAAYNEHRRLGGQGVPLVVIGDAVINGFSEEAMRRQLAPWLRG